MRRETLPPARRAPAPVGAGPPIDHRALPFARPAVPRHRRLFHPVTGWFRRFERATEHLLSTHLYPNVPALPRIYSSYLERHLTLMEGEVAMAGLPAAFDGVRILLITDIHLGPFLRPASLLRVFDRLLAAGPDLVLLGGDLTTARLDEFPPGTAAFRALRAPLGVFAVLGNHDHYTGEPDRLRAMLGECGIAVLHNRAVVLERRAIGVAGVAGAAAPDRLVLAGIDDLHAGRPDLGAALAQAPRGLPIVLLSHNPDIVFEAARHGVGLVLSGHTHGGQVRIPGLPVLVRMSRYRLDEWCYDAGDARVIVSRGLGVTGLPVRLACPPEAVLITLRRAV
jgi:predicted MPP superfamily phosphohydrolase